MKTINILLAALLVSGPGWAETSAQTRPESATANDAGMIETPVGEAVERHSDPETVGTPWVRSEGSGEQESSDRVEVKDVVERQVKTVKLRNVVPPIRFNSGEVDIPEHYVALLREALAKVKTYTNVRLHFVGHTDNVALRGAAKDKYGDNVGLSRERAGVTAEFFKNALLLPPEAISYDGMGEQKPVASNATAAGRAKNRRVEVEMWYDEVKETHLQKEVLVSEQINRVKVCRVETVCKLSYKEGRSKRARIKNLVPPLHASDETAGVPAAFSHKILQALNQLKNKQHVVVKFVGFTDGLPLQGRDARIYGSHLSLSKARARRTALAVQEALKLPSGSVDSDGRGAAMPLASDDTDSGRTLNRRVEVEFWYDDPFQEVSDEPQLCPETAGAETVTRVYDPPSGAIAPIRFAEGKPVVTETYLSRLRQSLDQVKGKSNVRVRFIGYTANERLDRRMAMVYGDDVGLSTARARRVMEAIQRALMLEDKQVEHEGHGFVQSQDVVNAGFIESDESRVDVKVVYDELADLDDSDAMEITRISREVEPANPFALNLMRITVDGKPLYDAGKSTPDVQRCMDVALDKARIRFKFDNLELKPRLNITAWPLAVRYQDDAATEFPENLLTFRSYNNYPAFIKRGEVRLFGRDQSTRDTPLAVVPLGADGRAEWQAAFDTYQAPGRELKYLLRVYDADGRFDETAPQSLWIVDQLPLERLDDDKDRELLAGYGENRLAVQNIPIQGGTIKVYGKGIPSDHTVWFAGDRLPLGKRGDFVAEKILPKGEHTVEVAVLDSAGNGELFLRDLEMKRDDWFYVGIADFTASAADTNGPARLVTGKARYDNDLSVEGRIAGYVNGRFGDDWQLTASADTREGPVEDLFSNFLDKSPDALFRRIDPDYHYPTYGDDATVEEGAPTMGKFFLKLRKGKNYGLWGNFKIGYVDNSLAQVDRGLYGANVHLQSADTTRFGEERVVVDGFAAQPGTAAGRDEFRGTGGSLYYLRHQDILVGSDRLRIEIRDKDSNLVISAKNLTVGLDYTIDYLQGRVLLAEPLSATAADNLLVESGAGAGNEAYLVARYEFTPGFDDVKNLSNGARIHYWFGDHVRVGMVTNENKESGETSKLNGGDLLVRKNGQTWLKIESAKSEGLGVSSLQSGDGGFNFDTTQQVDVLGAKGSAYRVDASMGLGDIYEGGRGSATLYKQFAEAGYSAPGLSVGKDTDQYGASLSLPVNDKIGLRAKADRRVQDEGLETAAGEVDVDYTLDRHWTLSGGARNEYRNDRSPQVPLTQIEGERTDLVARATYDSRERWLAYGYVQDTVNISGNQQENGRVGSGGAYRVTDRFKLTGEASTGELGEAGKLGVEYLYSDRTNLYANYALENERTDNGVWARKGNWASGFRSHYSDTTSVYLEERYTYGDVPTGLTHATGVDLAPNDRWNLGANVDFGTLRDNNTGARTERTAVAVRVGYGYDAVALASALEYRVDRSEGSDLTWSKRTTWLTKNSLKYQISPDWRFIGKFDHSRSESSLGNFYDGRYTEFVAGYGYRPVENDWLNALVKYTYFYNLPSAGQTTIANSAAAFIQKSHIFSLDTLYDLTPNWTIGGKYAYRLGQVSPDRQNRQFFDSNAHLYVLRADWHFIHRWDALLEGRMLDLPEAQDRRSGALVAIYRHVNEHVKLGAGYNFTDFSDDLTDLDYDNQGIFINIVGSI